jgi:hypothetical protein
MACKHLPVHIAGAKFPSVNCVCRCSQGQIIKKKLHIKISVLGEWKKIEIIFQPSRTYEK